MSQCFWHRSGLIFVLTITVAVSCSRPARDPLPGIPRLILWAWERPENLTFIVPETTGVAFLAETVFLNERGFTFRPRMQPLRVPPGTPLIAVVRIESRGPANASVEEVARQMLRVTEQPGVKVLQIDYDARFSDRTFYGRLLGELRKRMRPDMPLEMTALVSWCLSDDWIRRLPVADAIPMFFRMGVDPHRISERLREPLCQSSVGVSMDENYRDTPRNRRVYVFSPRSWIESDYRALLGELSR
ncbi:MAG: DUF3142 domain-containing protein [Acidobacteriota bacterium]|nr:DUF3142 domain-containing protein [Acidobacteriota bacterium]